MNPILLKPQSQVGSQVVQGKVFRHRQGPPNTMMMKHKLCRMCSKATDG